MNGTDGQGSNRPGLLREDTLVSGVGLTQLLHQCTQCGRVAAPSEPGNRGANGWTKARDMPEGLPCVDVGKVHLDGGVRHRLDAVMQGNAGMGVGPGIDDTPIDMADRTMHQVDQGTFVIGLMALHINTKLHRETPEVFVDVVHGNGTVNPWLPRSEKVEIGTVQYQEAMSCCHGNETRYP